MTATSRPSWYRRLVAAALAAVGVVAVALPHQLQPFQVEQVSAALVLSAATLGLGLLVGFTGQMSLGHGAFFGLGAYTTAVLVHSYGWPYLATVVAAALVCFAIGVGVGFPALRLDGSYLALLTLGLAAVFPVLVRRYESITRGNRGVRVDRFEPPRGAGLAVDQWTYYLVLLVVLGLFAGAWNLVRSRMGRAMVSVRDNPLAAEAAGIDVARIKILTFGLSAMYAGIAGALNTMLVGAVSPDSFGITRSIDLLAGLVIGGLGSVLGPLLGGFVAHYLPRYAGDVNENLAGVAYGAALIVLMYIAPGGLASLGRGVRDSVLRRSQNRRPRGGPPPRKEPSMTTSSRAGTLPVALLLSVALIAAGCAGRDDEGAAEGDDPAGEPGSSAGLVDVSECPSGYDAAGGVTDSEIRVAGSFPFSGPASSLSFLATGIEAYFNYYNETEGGFEGRHIVYEAADDGYEPARTLENVKSNLSDEPFAFLGMVGTPNNLFVWDDINAACIPHLFVNTGAAEWGADPESHPWTVGGLPSYQLEMAALVRYLDEQEPDARKIALLYQNDDFGESYRSGLQKAVDNAGGDFEIVATETHERGEVQIDTQMNNLAASDADIFVGGVTGEVCTNAIKAYGESRWDPIPYISYTCQTDNFLQAAGPDGVPKDELYAAGVLSGRYTIDASDPANADHPGIAEYNANIEKYAPEGRAVIPTVGLFWTGWQQAWLFTTALEEAQELTRPAVMEAVRSMDVQGLLTPDGIHFNLDGADDGFPFETFSIARYDGDLWEELDLFDFEGRTIDFVDESALGE